MTYTGPQVLDYGLSIRIHSANLLLSERSIPRDLADLQFE